jgi:membrane protein YdbS with pleckstrin-like domain
VAETAAPPGRVDADPLRIRPPRYRLNRRFVLWRTLNTLFWFAGVAGGLRLLYGYYEPVRPWLGPLLWIVTAVFAVNLVFMPAYRYRIHRWETSDRAVYALTGWLWREWRIVPVSRIQSVDTVQGPLERLLRLATVQVTTASREGRVKIEGLDAAVAEDVVRRLSEITQDTTGDAT